MRKALKVIAIFGALTVAMVIVAELTLSKSSPTTSPTTVSMQPVAPARPAQTSPSTKQSSTNSIVRQQDRVKDAVLAASTATSQLSEALFLPKPQMQQIVESLVVPSKQPAFEQGYLAAAKSEARVLGYSDPSQALAQADFYVVTQMYWVQRFSKARATIWLYNIAHFATPPDQKTVQAYAITHPGQTPPNQDYKVPSITIVQMQWQNGHWLWTGNQDPPADKVPPQEGHPTFQQAVDAFMPYIRSFKNYASLQ